jgi:hypothetical protein
VTRISTKANRFQKVTGDVAFDADGIADGAVQAIIKVNEDGYVPEGVTVRSQIDRTMFTAEFSTQLLNKLDRDSNVRSVAVSRNLRIID